MIAADIHFMTLFGIQIQYQYNEISGGGKLVLRKLYRSQLQARENAEKAVSNWMDSIARDGQKSRLFTVDLDIRPKWEVLDFEVDTH